jgi:hypothetical protein
MTGQTSNTNIHSNGVEDHPSLVWLFRYHASMPANVAAVETSSPMQRAAGEVWRRLRVCISANVADHRPGAHDARSGTATPSPGSVYLLCSASFCVLQYSNDLLPLLVGKLVHRRRPQSSKVNLRHLPQNTILDHVVPFCVWVFEA